MAPWPRSLPRGLQYDDYSGIDERKVVVPSWNAAPLREVVRAGSAVAVISVTESDVRTAVHSEVLPSVAEAEQRPNEIYERECVQASDTFADLPDEMKQGALLSDSEESLEEE